MLFRTGRVGIVCAIALMLIILAIRRHYTQHDHYLKPDESLPPGDWNLHCREHGFSAFDQRRRVFDLVLFSTELDWLEIRLHSYAPYVDYFVIVESPTTFTREAKSLHLKDNWDRFKQYHHQIIYKVVEDPIDSTRHWDHEDFLRNALLNEVFPDLAEGPQAARKNDVLIVSDVDELLKPGALLLLRHCDFPKRLTLRTQLYYYSFQWLRRGEQWPHPQATTFGGSVESTIAPNDLRMSLLGPGLRPSAALARWWHSATLWNAGWHCSSCFNTIEAIQIKMDSFSHQIWNTPENRNASNIVYRVKNGLDLFGRPNEVYDKIEEPEDVPHYVDYAHEWKGKFGYLIDRHGDKAGFEDSIALSSIESR